MESRKRLSRALKRLPRPTNPLYAMEAVFVSTEAVDANLSQITIYGETERWVPKWESVGAMTAGDLLWVQWSDNMDLTICGVIVGNRFLADQEESP